MEHLINTITTIIFLLAIRQVAAVDFVIKDDNCDGGVTLTSESSHTTYRTTANKEYQPCMAISSRSLPKVVDYNVTISLQAYGGSTPTLMFNIKDESNYDMVYFRSERYDCLGVASVVDGTFNKYTNSPGYETYCDGYRTVEGEWYQVTVKVQVDSFKVSIDGVFSLEFPTVLPQTPSAGLLQAMTYKAECNPDCQFGFRSIDVVPDTASDTQVTEYGTFVTPTYHADSLYQHQVEFHQLERVSETYCFVSLHIKHIDVGPAEIYVHDQLIDNTYVGSIKFYQTIGPELKVYFYSANMDSQFTGYTIDYHVFACGIDNPDMSFICEPGNHVVLYEDYFRSSIFVSDPNHYRSDNDLSKGWRQFKSCAGDMLESSTPNSSNICGTRDPIWLQEPEGDNTVGLSTGTACVYTQNDECSAQWPVPIYGCGDFYIYYLLPSPQLSGYCAGNLLHCSSKNMTSITGSGCSPCLDVLLPDMNGAPEIGEWEESTNLWYNIPCTVQEPNDPSPHLQYQYKWLIDYGTHKITLHDYDEKPTPATTVLLMSRLFSNIHMQNNLICSARVHMVIEGHDLYGDWLESEPKFIGLKFTESYKEILVSDGGPTLGFQFTMPINCDGNTCVDPKDCSTEVYLMTEHRGLTKQACVNHLYWEPELLHGDGCSTSVPCSNWNFPKQMTIVAKDTRQSGLEAFTHTLYAVTKDSRPKWDKLEATAKVRVIPDESLGGASKQDAKCTSNNDPHLTTWRPQKYDNHLEGEFVLYRSKPVADPDMEVLVTARYKHCRWNVDGVAPEVACNVAVGVRVKNEAIVINAQAVGEKHIYFGPGYGERGFQVTVTKDYKTYTVLLPRGETVTATMRREYNNDWINIEIVASKSEVQVRTGPDSDGNGLCGKLDVPPTSNELVFRDGRRYLGSLGEGYPQIPEFSEDWRARADEEMILKDPNFGPTPFGKPPAHACSVYVINDFKHSAGNLNDETVPRIEPCIPYTRPCIPTQTTGDDKCDLLDELRQQASTSTRQFSKTKNIAKAIQGTQTIKQRKAPQAPWSLLTAENYCQSFIGDSPIAAVCDAVVPGEVEIYMEQCIADIMLTNDTTWATSTLNSLRETCTYSLSQNLTMWEVDESENVTEIKPPPYLTEKMCPEDCSSNGVCTSGQCICDTGFIGFDCSQSVNTSPNLRTIMDTMCDTFDGCDDFRLIGDYFVYGDDLACYFAEDQTNNGEYIRGQLLSYDYISCPVSQLKTSKLGYTKHTLSVTNDRVHMSQDVDVLVVTAPCVTCDSEDGGFAGALNIDTCLIENQCIHSGTANQYAADVCQFCDPSLDPYGWSDCSNKDGAGLNSVHIGMIVLGCTVLVAAVVVGSVYIRYRSKNRKVQPSDDIGLETPATARGIHVEVEENKTDG